MDHHASFELLEKRIKATALQDGAIAVVVFGLAIVVALATATLLKGGVTMRSGMMAAIALGLGWAAWVMLQSARALSPAKDTKLYKELAGGGQDIGWAHLTTGALSAMKVYFLDGSMCTVYASARDGETLISLLSERAPHAIIGYGQEQETAYVAMVRR
jgi:hypothetical protein